MKETRRASSLPTADPRRDGPGRAALVLRPSSTGAAPPAPPLHEPPAAPVLFWGVWRGEARREGRSKVVAKQDFCWSVSSLLYFLLKDKAGMRCVCGEERRQKIFQEWH